LSPTSASVVSRRLAIEARSAARPGHLGGVDDAGLDQVLELAGGGVEAGGTGLALRLLDGDVALDAGVLGDPVGRRGERLPHGAGAGGLVALELQLVDRSAGPEQRGAATGDDALLDGRPGRREGVLDAVLLLLELHLGGGADLDHGHAPGQLGQALLQLLAVPVRVGVLDLGLDLVDPALHVLLGPATVDDGGVVLGDDDLAGGAEQVEGGVLELEADLLGDDLAPVRMAMSCSIALRRSPKPGALTAADVNVPRILLTTSTARASPSTSSATTSSCLLDCMTFSRTGTRSCTAPTLPLTRRMNGSSRTVSWRSASVTKYGDR
jgi:hypothetical protein